MCGTPSESRATVAGPEMGAVRAPEVRASGRQANHHTETAAATSRTAIRMLTTRRILRSVTQQRLYRAPRPASLLSLDA